MADITCMKEEYIAFTVRRIRLEYGLAHGPCQPQFNYQIKLDFDKWQIQKNIQMSKYSDCLNAVYLFYRAVQ